MSGSALRSHMPSEGLAPLLSLGTLTETIDISLSPRLGNYRMPKPLFAAEPVLVAGLGLPL